MVEYRKCAECRASFTPRRGNAGRFCTQSCYHESLRFKPERDFWPRVDRMGEHWLWTGPTFKKTGYGMAYVNGKTVSAHRLACEVRWGPIPDGVIVRHGCDIRLCMLHLSYGTYVDNMRDAVERGRISRGEGRPAAKMTELTVAEVRRRARNGERGCDLAAEFGVSRSVMSAILNGKSWKHVKPSPGTEPAAAA